jgi:hypothetical protein
LISPPGRVGVEGETLMMIRLLRASKIVKEIEFAAALPPLEIHRISIDLMFENFERNETHLWRREDDTRGARHEVQVIADGGIPALKALLNRIEISFDHCIENRRKTKSGERNWVNQFRSPGVLAAIVQD